MLSKEQTTTIYIIMCFLKWDITMWTKQGNFSPHKDCIHLHYHCGFISEVLISLRMWLYQVLDILEPAQHHQPTIIQNIILDLPTSESLRIPLRKSKITLSKRKVWKYASYQAPQCLFIQKFKSHCSRHLFLILWANNREQNIWS